jgi:hypothetical protein
MLAKGTFYFLVLQFPCDIWLIFDQPDVQIIFFIYERLYAQFKMPLLLFTHNQMRKMTII